MEEASNDMESVFLVRYMRETGTVVQNLWYDVLEPHDLTWLQFEILVLLSENGELKQTEIGDAVGLDRSSMVSVIDRMEERSLVARQPCPYDRRAVHIAITPKGQERLRQVTPLVRAHDQDLMNGLGVAERDMLSSFLNRLSAARATVADADTGRAQVA